ncbi:WW domain-containing protein [Madurella fahalii]|uniref:WW domain-containing protein n=1 Tax=Madurella fahalii TaxID=1157608 RepID=A0ABQ0G363_9PEZI
MGSAQNRKRARVDVLSQEHRPNKKIRSKGTLHRGLSNFPPEFWDNLSKVWLTRRALRELDRRNSAQPAPRPVAPAVYTTDLARFARSGGPDIRHLRGCPEPKDVVCTMASRRSVSSRQTKSKSTGATTVSSKARRSSAYDDDFEQHLMDYNIRLPRHKLPDDRPAPKPENLHDCHQFLATNRPSLSPSRFTETAFEDFQQKNETRSEGSVMRNVIPIITGNASIPNENNLPFTNCESLTEGATVTPVPDFFDGAELGVVDKAVREDLNRTIIPTKHADVPVAPNFFLEAKAPKGGADVARRQACYDGAHGCRAMHALQNYGEEEPGFDGNAYTYSSTYHAGTGTLQLYAHHVTPPTVPGGRPEYHMTQLDSYAMTGKRGRFVEGATAFWNARDLAQRHRDRLIQAANAVARQSNIEAPSEPETGPVAEQYEDSTADEFVDCEDHIESQAVGTKNHAASGYVDEEPALPQYLHEGEGEPSQESTSLDAETSMSFATSFTSNPSQRQTSSKRTRTSHSHPSNSQPHKKRGPAKKSTRQRASRRTAVSSTQDSRSTESVILPSTPAEDYWTWSDRHQKWYHLNEDGSYTWKDGD